MVAEANGWNPRAKALHLAAFLRGDGPTSSRHFWKSKSLISKPYRVRLSYCLEGSALKNKNRLQLKSRYQKAGESIQEFVADIQRLSHLAFSDCPVETRQDLTLQNFIDSMRDPETQKALRLAYVKDIGYALIYAHKIEATQQVTHKDWHLIRAVSAIDSDSDFIKLIENLLRKIRNLEKRNGGRNTEIQNCTCGAIGRVRINYPTSIDGVNNLPPHQRKQIYSHLVGAESQKPHFKVFHISSIIGGDNGLFLMGHVNKVPFKMIIDT
ncbi:gag-Pol polyprotein [Nephila pilipes]|uniref:Gag-Pol polyprotein n=1 Tax=Nephila pilipes TaxID=299642 RepID=A0A8X6MXA8_NEPPI|nr:gag-Pol polyprotein [Nephila pilipes]